MSRIKIEKSIPLPERGGFLGPASERSQLINLFSEMAEGDSIVLSKNQANCLCSAVSRMFNGSSIREEQWRASRRSLPDGNYRVWKVRRDK